MSLLKSRASIDVDLGEGYGNWVAGPDNELISLISYANVACGFHASDPLIMQRTVRACKEANVKIGAHPGLPDIQGFGRRMMNLSLEEHTANVIYQIGALKGFLDAESLPLSHVKPHGTLYNCSYRDEEICRAVYKGIAHFKDVPVFGLAGSWHEKIAKEMNIPFVAQLNGDLNYDRLGHTIIERKKSPWRAEDTARQVRQQLYEGSVTAVTGEIIPVGVGDYPVSICCHSDSVNSVELVKATKAVVDEFNDQYFPESDVENELHE